MIQSLTKLINNISLLSLLFIGISIFLFILLIVQQIKLSAVIRKARQDAVKRSKAVIGGQMTEQLAPYLPDFPCNPSDVRFIGKPVDYIGFSGLSEKNEVDEVVFIEVKTGSSKLNEHEKKLKTAIEKGRVKYVEYCFKG